MSASRTSDGAQDDTLGADDSSPVRSGETPLVRGATVGRYVVLDKVGHGGMGVVYSAYDPELSRRVALKLLVPGHGDPTIRAGDRVRLVREAQAMAKLTHPNVVTVYDAGTFDGSVFLAMEFVEGGTLGTRMREGPPWRSLLPLFLDAGRGLAAAHAAGLVHRDFKPDNVLLTAGGVAKVSDFGLARASTTTEASTRDWGPMQDALSDEITRAGSIVGTPAYMAPEQHLGAPADARSDQFSFCVALFEGLFGERPFRARSMVALVEAVTSGTIAEPPGARDVPTRLRRIVQRGLATDPADRWPSMPALLDALQTDPSRRRTRRIAAAAVGTTLLFGVGGLFALEHRRREACRSEGAMLDAVWNGPRRDAIAAAVRETGVSYAEPTVARISALVEPWIGRWEAARTQTCLAERDDDHGGLALRRGCLDERRAHLEVVLESLEHADAESVAIAVQTVAALPRIEPCSDVAWLQRQRADGEPGQGAQVASSIARLAALTRTHQLDRGLALARELEGQTEHDPARRAEVLRWRGLLEHEAGDAAAAVASLRAAYLQAGRHHADRVAALAAVDLTMIVGVRMGDVAAGRDWADHATMMTERDPDPELRLDLLYAVGALETSAENYEAGIARLREQAELAAAVYGDDHPETAYAQMALSNAYSRAARYPEARTELERAGATFADSHGPTHPVVAAAKYNLGTLSFREGRFAEALTLHREVLALREAVFPSGHAEIAASHSAIASVSATMGDVAGALENHRRAHAMLVALYGEDNPRTLSELHNVVQDLLELERFHQAEPEIERLCAHAERTRSADPDAWVECLGQRASVLTGRGRTAEAVVSAEAAMTAGIELYGATHPESGTVVFNYGIALFAAGHWARGCDELRRGVAIWRETLADDHPTVREGEETLARDCGPREVVVR